MDARAQGAVEHVIFADKQCAYEEGLELRCGAGDELSGRDEDGQSDENEKTREAHDVVGLRCVGPLSIDLYTGVNVLEVRISHKS